MRNMQGAIMMEVLIAILVLAIGLLGLASLQVFSLQAVQTSYWRSVASDLANDLADRVRTNRSPWVAVPQGTQPVDAAGHAIPYPTDYAEVVCSAGTGSSVGTYTCTPPANGTGTYLDGNYAARDLEEWLSEVLKSLPGGTGTAMICRGTNTALGTGANANTAVNDYTSSNFTTATNCLATTDTAYNAAPYMIRIYWYDKNTGYQMFATTFQ